MNTTRMGKFQAELQKLMESHQTHPMILAFEGDDKKIYFATAGNPSIEWIARSMEAFMLRLAENVERQQMLGTRKPFEL